jgi:undecaprenyl pyrophosphate phosphatase UppP
MIKHYLVDSPPAEPSTSVEVRHSSSRLISRCHAVWGILVVCIGVLGVLHSWWPDRALALGKNVAVLFGGVLGSLVISHFYWYVRRLPLPSIAEVREFSRRDSRAVYLLLFFLVGAHQIGALLHGTSVSGTADELKGYFIGGVCALLLIRTSGLLWQNFFEKLRKLSADQGLR